MTRSLPILDISSWIEESNQDQEHINDLKVQVKREWDQAMRDFGFAIITGHGLSPALFENLLSEGKQFFEQNLSEKIQFNHGHYGHPNGGYTPPGYETVQLSMNEEDNNSHGTAKPKYDPVENFVFTSPPNLFSMATGERRQPFPSADVYFERMNGLLATLHRLSAAALNLPDLEYFNKFYWPEHEKMGRNGNTLRITHYPGHHHPVFSEVTRECESSEELQFDENVRYGAHTDYQGFTILKPDVNDWHEMPFALGDQRGTVRFGGLEVFLRKEQQWLPVRIERDLNALVVNAGDLFQRWTGDRWHSALHRVVHLSIDPSKETPAAVDLANRQDPLSSLDLSRYSLVFFTGPLEEAMIESIDGIDADLESSPPPRRYPPIKSHDHLLSKLNRTNQHQN